MGVHGGRIRQVIAENRKNEGEILDWKRQQRRSSIQYSELRLREVIGGTSISDER